ncbi:MAG: hypothetical protein J7K57_05065 [Palaeococcus sp.]|uniref:hypothetical protein n=1 Tax=Palaeococcus sp. (in: euryarchaeotes) TaxID=2820298 RepID=UPI0025DC44E4|nr:hypothetical protein [Palaeococcus sp. (in: euryarchaeotes)]MCD6559225.1 hypothetical protein [Palaeococcus sp. (in: euryarchaeotes)]
MRFPIKSSTRGGEYKVVEHSNAGISPLLGAPAETVKNVNDIGGVGMPMYLITHKWTDAEALGAIKEAAKFFERLSELPEGIEFLASYNFNLGSYTLWRATSREKLEKLLESAPIFKKNAEIVEIVQSYPPTVEYTVRMWKMIISMGEK